MLPFAMYYLKFFDISAIDGGICMVFTDAWIVSPSKYNSLSSPLYHSSKRRSNASWWYFDLKFLECVCNNKFGISVTALIDIPFNSELWIHSFNSLVVSSIYLFPREPECKRKRFLRQKTILSYTMSIVFDEIVLPVCNQGYWVVREAVASLSFTCRWYIVFVIIRCFVSSITLCRFSPVSVLFVLLQCWHVKCSFDRKLYTGYDGEVSVLGKG